MSHNFQTISKKMSVCTVSQEKYYIELVQKKQSFVTLKVCCTVPSNEKKIFKYDDNQDHETCCMECYNDGFF